MKVLAAVLLLSGIACAEACETGWVQRPNTDLCYWFDQSAASWNAAWEKCDHENAILTTVVDQEEQDFISGLIKSQSSDVWIGLSDTDISEGIWRWTGYACMNYTNWDAGQPNYGNGGQDCVAIKNIQTSSNRWDDRSCADLLPYICKKKTVGSITNLQFSEVCDNNCNTKFPPDTCVYNDYPNSICTYHVVEFKYTSNGVNTSYVVCETELPATTTTAGPSTTFTTETTSINTADPDAPTTTTAPPTTRSHTNPPSPPIITTPACGSGWTLRPGTTLCYRLETAKFSWDSARTSCNALGGGLTTIADQAEKDYVSAFSDTANDYLWIGMTDSAGQGIWNWQNSPCVSLIDWNSGEPSYGNGGKECAIFLMKVSNYTWDDVGCSATFPYVCRKDIGPASEANAGCNHGCRHTPGCTGYTYKSGQCTLHVRKDIRTIKGVATTVITCEKYPPPWPRRHRHKNYDSDCEENARFEFSHPSPLFSRFGAKGRKVTSDEADSIFPWL